VKSKLLSFQWDVAVVLRTHRLFSDPPAAIFGSMAKPVIRFLLAFTLGCICATSGSLPDDCDVCGKRLGRRAWTYREQTCCSQICVDELRPVCSVCHAVIRGNYKEADGQTYCGESCFQTILPTCEICKSPIQSGFSITQHNYCKACVDTKPSCFSCGLPAVYPTRLKDGREICNGCMRWAVSSQKMAQLHYDRARRQLEAWTALKLASIPELKLVNRDEIQRLSKDIRKSDSPVSVRGLYSRQVTVRRTFFGAWKQESTEAEEKIYIVDHLADEVFRVAATHELMHDLIHEHFPRLKEAPLWVHEGICQQAAAELCRRRNYSDSLHGIENCTDPDYGGGYRFINNLTGFEGWHALRRWMETVDLSTLPDSPP
jgi:hypothetical protein